LDASNTHAGEEFCTGPDAPVAGYRFDDKGLQERRVRLPYCRIGKGRG
jgi:hypothetical protein